MQSTKRSNQEIFWGNKRKRQYNANIRPRSGGISMCVPLTKIWRTRPLRPSCGFPWHSGNSSGGVGII